MGWYRFQGDNRAAKIIGGALMIVGLLLLLISMPGWLWLTLLGVLLISVGYLLWRFV